MTQEATFKYISLSEIVASTTNPRKHFDAAKLEELAASIKAGGVHTPVLVRPLPASRLEDTASMRPRPAYELVVGERRLRASKMAGLKAMPATVRELTDEVVLEIQLIENLQRDDLTELEEAEGYQTLIERSGIAAEDIATKVGKSRSYIYGRLKLMDLCIEGRDAMRKGDIDASKALLIARIPDTAVQVKALGSITQYGHRSYRECSDIIQRSYMLKLASACFNRTSADLVEGAGACAACPKRTGANPDLFSDVKGADMCLDPTCFHAKEHAHQEQVLRAARDRGATIIEGREAKELMPSKYDGRIEGYRRLDDKADSPTDQPLRKLIGKIMVERGVQEVLLANPHKEDELIACLPVETVSELLQAASSKSTKAAEAAATVARQSQWEKEHAANQAKEKAKRDYETAWRWGLMESAWSEIESGTLDPQPEVMRYLANDLAKRLNKDQCKRLCKLLELGKVAPKEGLLAWVKDIANPYMALQLLVMHADVEYRSWLSDGTEANEGLLLVAKAYALTPETAQDAVKQAIRAATKAAKAQNATSAEGPAAHAGGERVGRSNASSGARGARGQARGKTRADSKPKLSAEDAQRGIAAAMRDDESGLDAEAGKTESVDGCAADEWKDSAWPYPAEGSKEAA